MKHPIVLTACLALLTVAKAQQRLPYQDPSLSAKERAIDLCSRLTVEEKAKIMMDRSKAIERPEAGISIPAFDWWSEALHGVGRNGLATMFPQCIGMAAAFDTALIYDVYNAVSDEARAKNTFARHNGGSYRYAGLSFWTPNVNVFRDPRWGRGQETYGEDPYVNAVMGCAVVRGLQGPSGGRYRKLLACAKHFTVHSGPEKTRHYFDIRDIDQRDFWETYMLAFESLVRDADVREVMCAYQRIDGEPCCGSNAILRDILRNKWGFDGLVVSDCGAISDFWRKGHHEVSADPAAASAKAVLAGTDVECGGNYTALPLAVRRGDISEESVDESVIRLLTARFELGDFDPDSLVEWTKIGMDVVACAEHRDLSLRAAQESMVLLQNRGNLLPLSKSDAGKIMVMGPNAADSLMLWGIYFGEPAHTVTPLEGIESKVGKVPYAKGCELTSLVECESLFGNFVAPDGKRGMRALYWNNESHDGVPVVERTYGAKVNKDNGGNTVFETGVELEHFSLRLRGSFKAERTETLFLDLLNDDGSRIIVNGDTIHGRWKSEYVRVNHFPFPVESGKSYDIQVDYRQIDGSASFAFDIVRERSIVPADVVRRAADAEIIIFVGGISPNLEKEEAKVTAPGFDNGDRTSIELPLAQRQVLKALHDAGKKIVFVNCSGSAVALAPEVETCDAILQAWYAGERGGDAIADVIFGDYNPSGRLPVTFYASDDDMPVFDDYSMRAGKGRTYRYFTGKPLFEFGHGLSYTSFAYSDVRWDDKAGGVRFTLKNTGAADGTEVALAYVRDKDDRKGPKKSLRGFLRVELKAGESRELFLPMGRESFALWNEAKGAMAVKAGGRYQVMLGGKTLNVRM